MSCGTARLRRRTSRGLTTSLEKKGVLSPVQLSMQTVPHDDPTESAGHRAVLGGHHRVAAMQDVDPHQLMPVLHYDEVHPPRGDAAYPYEGRPAALHEAATLTEGLAAEKRRDPPRDMQKFSSEQYAQDKAREEAGNAPATNKPRPKPVPILGL